MPKSRQRTKKPVQKGRNTHSRADVKRINEAYVKKFEEYSGYELEQLQTMLEARTERGTYLHALLKVIEFKKSPPKKNVMEEESTIIENTINE